MMRKIFLYGMLGVVFLTAAGCRDYLDFSNEDEIGIKAVGTQQETFVVFDNRGADNSVPVTVYSNINRTEGDYIMAVSKNSISSSRKWEPAPNGYEFYISYDLYFQDNIFSTENINITYTLNTPILARIDAAKTNTILIPSLASKIDGDKDTLLSQDKYLVIKANGASFRLRKSASTVTPIKGTALVNAGETAVYKLLSSDDIASYSIDGKSFPVDNAVQSGYITFFTFDGSAISYNGEKALTINNLSIAP